MQLWSPTLRRDINKMEKFSVKQRKGFLNSTISATKDVFNGLNLSSSSKEDCENNSLRAISISTALTMLPWEGCSKKTSTLVLNQSTLLEGFDDPTSLEDFRLKSEPWQRSVAATFSDGSVQWRQRSVAQRSVAAALSGGSVQWRQRRRQHCGFLEMLRFFIPLHIPALPRCTSQRCLAAHPSAASLHIPALPRCTSQRCLAAHPNAASLHIPALPRCTSQRCLAAHPSAASLHIPALPCCTSQRCLAAHPSAALLHIPALLCCTSQRCLAAHPSAALLHIPALPLQPSVTVHAKAS
ncbi:hypothetical protein FHG87_021674 [Trinorchestia longiramus]|nr:hypothetical protein FHG87_021674 [Trinorchestia longiramus]